MKPTKSTRTVRLPHYESPEQVRRSLWSQMARTFIRMQREIEQMLAERDMTLPQFEVLETLRVFQGITQGELAERLLVTKGNVCGLLDRLEKLRWVERRPDAEDRRINRLYLTAAGQKKVHGVIRDHDGKILRLLNPLSDAKIKTLRSLLEELDVALDTSE